MRVAAIYDIHGNLPALEAVLDDVRRVGVDRIVVGGDVLPGPMPRETLALLRALDVPADFVRGNGDREVLEVLAGEEPAGVPEPFRPALRWVAEQLGPEDERMMAAWPATIRMPVEGLGQVLFCHATPRSDAEVFTRLTPVDRLLPVFEAADASVVVCGHTHMQFDRTVGTTRVVNAGSVGMPFGEPGAYWLLLAGGVELRRTSYDLRQAAQRVRRTAYPQAEEFAAREILSPHSESEMVELFARAELR
jgi:putative phosphoesterase